MTQQGAVTEAFVTWMRGERARQRLSAQALAQRCADLGMPSLNRATLAGIESGRRSYVTLDETAVIVRALQGTLYDALDRAAWVDDKVDPEVVDRMRALLRSFGFEESGGPDAPG